MKLIKLIIVGLCLMPFIVNAQQINRREYFFDTDPGVGKGINFTLSSRDTAQDTISFKMTGLALGFHRLYVRYKYTNSSWGMTEGRLFYIIDTTHSAKPKLSSKITYGEYFIDKDPGVGKGNALSAFTFSDTIMQNLNIKLNGINTGFHRIYIRYRDSTQNWGIPEDRLFYVYDTSSPSKPVESAKMVKGEYFIDTDPEAGNGITFNFTGPVDSVLATFNINTTGLSIGYHQVYARFIDVKNIWGHTQNVKFFICSNMLSSPSITGNTNYCSGDTIKLLGNTVSGASSYLWKGPNNFTSGILNLKIGNAQKNNAGDYKLYAIRSGGNDCDTSIASIVNVKIIEKSYNNIKIDTCESYMLNSILYTKTGNYIQHRTSHSGCDSIISLALTIVENNIGVIQNNEILTSQETGASYQWLDCNDNFAPIAGETLSIFKAKKTGKYAVQVFKKGCLDTSICYNITTIGFDNIDILSDIGIVPNPSNGEYILKSYRGLNNAEIKVTNNLGQIILEKHECSGFEINIDVTRQTSGIYFISVVQEGILYRSKIIKL